mmetsp:Transcript_96882/g.250598  ORF Transcript_96882/g.250598 Transcript_96882/m.250598 type:complete len:331 (+) Transcript_96882:1591-2583(+)
MIRQMIHSSSSVLPTLISTIFSAMVATFSGQILFSRLCTLRFSSASRSCTFTTLYAFSERSSTSRGPRGPWSRASRRSRGPSRRSRLSRSRLPPPPPSLTMREPKIERSGAPSSSSALALGRSRAWKRSPPRSPRSLRSSRSLMEDGSQVALLPLFSSGLSVADALQAESSSVARRVSSFSGVGRPSERKASSAVTGSREPSATTAPGLLSAAAAAASFFGPAIGTAAAAAKAARASSSTLLLGLPLPCVDCSTLVMEGAQVSRSASSSRLLEDAVLALGLGLGLTGLATFLALASSSQSSSSQPPSSEPSALAESEPSALESWSSDCSA